MGCTFLWLKIFWLSKEWANHLYYLLWPFRLAFQCACSNLLIVCLLSRYSKVKASVPGESNKLGEWLSDWLSTRFFSAGQCSNRGHERNKILHKGSLGGLRMMPEHRIPTSCVHAQRKCTIPHSTMKIQMVSQMSSLQSYLYRTSVVVTALCNQPEAFASDLSDDQSRYSWYKYAAIFDSETCIVWWWLLCVMHC